MALSSLREATYFPRRSLNATTRRLDRTHPTLTYPQAVKNTLHGKSRRFQIILDNENRDIIPVRNDQWSFRTGL